MRFLQIALHLISKNMVSFVSPAIHAYPDTKRTFPYIVGLHIPFVLQKILYH